MAVFRRVVTAAAISLIPDEQLEMAQRIGAALVLTSMGGSKLNQDLRFSSWDN
jgi:hypothetical protein